MKCGMKKNEEREEQEQERTGDIKNECGMKKMRSVRSRSRRGEET